MIINITPTSHDPTACPNCGNEDISLWADDGESSLSDWWECRSDGYFHDGRAFDYSRHGCGSTGAVLDPTDPTKTQNGLPATEETTLPVPISVIKTCRLALETWADDLDFGIEDDHPGTEKLISDTDRFLHDLLEKAGAL